jgi:rod shape-determining protein MreD
MKKILFWQFALFVLLVFLQVCLFNRIHLWGVATPLVYTYYILKLPIRTNRNLVLILSALMGLILDIFGYTLGLNMLSLVIVGFMRYYFIKLFASRDVFDNYIPSFETFKKHMFMRYAGTLVLFHQIILFSIESSVMFIPLQLLLRIGGSSILTILLIFAFESIHFGKLNT